MGNVDETPCALWAEYSCIQEKRQEAFKINISSGENQLRIKGKHSMRVTCNKLVPRRDVGPMLV